MASANATSIASVDAEAPHEEVLLVEPEVGRSVATCPQCGIDQWPMLLRVFAAKGATIGFLCTACKVVSPL